MESSPYIAVQNSQALEKAKKAAEQKTGLRGNTALATALGGITPQAVSQWNHVPLRHVFEVERITGISKHELRPDFFGEAGAETAA